MGKNECSTAKGSNIPEKKLKNKENFYEKMKSNGKFYSFYFINSWKILLLSLF